VAKKNYWTNTAITDLQPIAAGDHTIGHPEIENFAVRFQPKASGGWSRSYVMTYRLGGRLRKLTIGKLSKITLDVAIDEARLAFAKLVGETPVDPAIERKANRDVHNDRLIDFVQPFLDSQKAKGLSDTWMHTQAMHLLGVTHKLTGAFKPAYFAGLHNLAPKLIDRRMVAEQLDKITQEKGQIAMTNARATLSKFFSWLISRHIAETNPVSGTEKIYADQVERTLSVEELVKVWHAADPAWQFGRIVRQLILTGGRRDQIGGLKHTELDLDAEIPMITLPRKAGLRARKKAVNGVENKRRRGGSKNNETFQIPLSPQSVELFRMEKMKKPVYVYGDDAGEGGFSGWSKSMPKLYEKIGDGVEHWTLHDLRRSFATIAVEKLDADPIVADACINHKPPSLTKGVMGTYQKAKLLEKRIELMNRWGAYIAEITKPTKPDLRVVEAA